MSDKKRILDIVKDVGRWSLSSSDGSCCCGSFSIGGLTVDMSCHKPQAWDDPYKLACNGTPVRTYGPDDSADQMEAVALYIAQDLVEKSYKYSRMGIRYCEADYDCPEPRCTYCRKPRADIEGYLCDACKKRSEARRHDHSRLAHFYGDEEVTGMTAVCLTIDMKEEPK